MLLDAQNEILNRCAVNDDSTKNYNNHKYFLRHLLFTFSGTCTLKAGVSGRSGKSDIMCWFR